jgi:hypothetical protein
MMDHPRGPHGLIRASKAINGEMPAMGRQAKSRATVKLLNALPDRGATRSEIVFLGMAVPLTRAADVQELLDELLSAGLIEEAPAEEDDSPARGCSPLYRPRRPEEGGATDAT